MSSSRRAIPKAWHPKRRVGLIGPLELATDLSQSIALGTAVVTVTPVALGVVATDPPVILRPRVAWSSAGVTSTRGRPPVFRARSRVIQLPAAQEAALTAATVTVTPVALGITTGGVSLALGTAVVTVTPVAIDIAAPAAPPAPIVIRPRVAWSNAGVTSTRGRPPVIRARSRTTLPSSPQTTALTAAVVTVTPVALGVTAAVSITLGTATVTATPVALTATPGAVSVALTATTVAVTPVALGVTPAVSLALTSATITVTAVALDIVSSPFLPDTNPITLTIRARAHTVTLRTDYSVTLHGRGHTATLRTEQESTTRSRGHGLTIREHV